MAERVASLRGRNAGPRAPALALTVIALVVACSPAAVSPSEPAASATPAVTIVPTGSPAVRPSPTVRPTAIASPTPGPSDPRYAELADPPIRFAVYDGWNPVSIVDFRSQLEALLPQVSGDVAEAWTAILGMIDDGQLRAIYVWPSPVEPFTDSLLVVVPAADATPLEAGDAIITALGGGAEDPRTVMLPAGQAARFEGTTTPAGGSPSHHVMYAIDLAGDGLVVLLATGPAGDEELTPLIDHLAETLSVR